MSDKISSKNQSGGITAKNVNVTDSSIVQHNQTKHKSERSNVWKIILGIVTFIAALIAVLSYFGIKP